jgi:hypothetical protein
MQRPSTQISTEYIMTLHAPLGAPQNVSSDLQIYTSPGGGWVMGPAIQGELVPPGGDWVRVMPNGTLKLDSRVSIRADDGSIIFMTYPGRIVVPEGAAAQFAAGDALGPDDLYFMIAPLFETTSKTYGWLNDLVTVGKMVSNKEGENGHVTYDIFAVR